MRELLKAILEVGPERGVEAARQRFLQVHGQGKLRVVLWGAGPLAATVLEGLGRAGLRPLALCDRNPERWHTFFGGLEILPPQEVLERYREDAVFIPAVYTNRALLAYLGTQGVRALPLAVLAWQLPEYLLPHCALDLPHRMHAEADQVEAAMELWADDASRREFLGQVQWRADLDGSRLAPALPSEAMFNPTDLLAFQPGEHFVDCGAFDGDTIRAHLHHHAGGTGPITAIEPDPCTFARLEAFRASLPPAQAGRITTLQFALGAAPGTISFRATGSVVSSADTSGEVQVRRERLSDLVSGATFVKMDIEGAEGEALEGAAELLRRDRPALGICLYHRNEDLWRLPLLIRSLCPGYRLFLRRFSDECWEQVCYAVPKERLKA